MRASRRLEQIIPKNGHGNGSDGWEILYKSRALEREGITVINLTIGEPDRKTDPRILEAMLSSARGGLTGYCPVEGVGELRDAVAKRYCDRYGTQTTRNEVAIVPGGQFGLFSALIATCDPGDRIFYLDPYYTTYPGTIRAADGVDHALPTFAEDGFIPRPERWNNLPDARALLLNSPNNPTGAVYDPAAMQAIARFCQERDLWLISDEVYESQIWQGGHISAASLPDMRARSLVIGSFSKSYAMTGSRLGWVVAPSKIIAGLTDFATHSTYGGAGFVQMAGLFALSLGDEFEAKSAAIYRQRRDMCLELMRELNWNAYVPPQGGMYVMVDIRSTGLTGLEFATRLLAEHRIAVMPGESFGHAAEGHLRIALTVPDFALRDAMRRLILFAQELAYATGN